MEWLTLSETWLIGLTEVVPISWFVVVGAAIEEIIAPIPSPLVMTAAGSLAQAQGKTLISLAFLSLIGAVIKTVASWLVYFVADKAEDVVVGKWGKYLGVSKGEVEMIGRYFNGGVKDTLMVFLARAIPIMPTAPVSVVCGIIKIDIKAYLLGTLCGTVVRNLIYLSIGYIGLSSAEALLHGLNSMESLVQVVLAAVAVTTVLLLYYRRRREKDIMGLIKRTFRLK